MDKGFTESEELPPPPPKGSWEGWLAVGVLIVAGLIVAFLFGTFDRPKSQVAGATHPAVGTKFDTIDLKPLEANDAPFTAEDLKGKITLINFWGPWCGPCLQEFPELVHMVDHHRGDKQFQMVFVSCSQNGKDQAPEHLSATRELLVSEGYDIRCFTDPAHTTIQAVQKATMQENFYFPTTMMIGTDGKIAALWMGYNTYYVEEMHDMVHKALHELEAHGG
jgi:cytochrome c biogenesis protein CcmG/thiol:disulfide interchange protein DsbE